MVCKCQGGKIACDRECKYTTCPKGFELVQHKGECCRCQPISTTSTPAVTTTAKTTVIPTTQAPRTCDKRTKYEKYVDNDRCESTQNIEKNSCHGDCESEIVEDIVQGLSIKNGRCCKPTGLRERHVWMKCPKKRGYTKLSYIFKYKTFSGCVCKLFDQSPFSDVPLWNRTSSFLLP